VNNALVIIFAGEAVEFGNCPQVSYSTRLLKFRVNPALIVATEHCLGPHPPTEQTSAERSVGEGRNAEPKTIREHVFFALALK
jgi:hypothetical protein